jgi:CRP-like cAMP-binding protein
VAGRARLRLGECLVPFGVHHIFRREAAMPGEERLEAQKIFSSLRPDQIDALSDAADVLEYKTGDTVYYQGKVADHIYVVLNGEVSLRLPGRGGIAIPIDVATPGVMFGACQCFDISTYALTAQCVEDSKLMKIDASALRHLMDDDLLMGYVIQRHISHIYFERYLETMKKLQAIVMTLPLDTEQ